MLTIRKTTKEEIDKIMSIYKFAREFMKETGNPYQWGNNRPAKETIIEDIENGVSYGVYENDELHGVFALIGGEDPTYKVIENGSWLNDEEYLTIHRIAGDGKVHGIMKTAVGFCKNLTDNIRIDTHKDNRIMQKQILKNGFKECGIIHLLDGSERIAYHWAKESN